MRKKARIHAHHGGGHLGFWDIVGLTGVVLIASSSWSVGSFEQEGSWYQLTSILPGERVPAWAHKGRMYRGIPVPRENVRIFAPDSDASAVVSTAFLREVAPPFEGRA